MARKNRRGRYTLALLAAGIALLAITPASASHGGIHPTFRNERVYFHCAGANKVENTGSAASPWNTTAPTGSYQAGNGCGWLDPGALTGPSADARYSGTFTGNLRSLTIEAHNLLVSQVDGNAIRRVTVELTVDGTPLLAADTYVDMTPELSSTGLTEKFLISIPAIGCAKEIKDAAGNVVDVKTAGLATEDGDGTESHEISLTLDSSYSDRGGAWVQDATEIPSGITFNPATLAPNKLTLETPATC